MRKIRAGKTLDCGCCGEYFEVWKGYIDQDQDNGYGICKRCQGFIADKNNREMDKAITVLRGGLNDDNRTQFDGFDRDRKEQIVFMAMDDGTLGFGCVVRVGI